MPTVLFNDMITTTKKHVLHIYQFDEVAAGVQDDFGATGLLDSEALNRFHQIFDLANAPLDDAKVRILAKLVTHEVVREYEIGLTDDHARLVFATALWRSLAPLEMHGEQMTWAPQINLHFRHLITAVQKGEHSIFIHDCDECDFGSGIRIHFPPTDHARTLEESVEISRQLIDVKLIEEIQSCEKQRVLLVAAVNKGQYELRPVAENEKLPPPGHVWALSSGQILYGPSVLPESGATQSPAPPTGFWNWLKSKFK